MSDSELWRQALNWLRSANVIPDGHLVLRSNARVYDLALALQDGTILCKTLEYIQPRCCAAMHESPEKPFLKRSNINLFLEQAQKVFGLKDGDIFTADELYYASNFAQVVEALSRISMTSKATSKGLRPFPQGGVAVSGGHDDEEQYQSLESLVGQNNLLSESRTVTDDGDMDDIYGSLAAVVDTSGPAMKGLEMASLDQGSTAYTDMISNREMDDDVYQAIATKDSKDKRSQVIGELLATEKNYVDVLETINGCFFKILKQAEGKLISRRDLGIVVSNVPDLLRAHKKFLEDLEKHLNARNGRMVSVPFTSIKVQFQAYGRFCCDIPDAIAKVRELNSKPKTKALLDKGLEESRSKKNRFPLGDLLNVPMQRILKYPLLLKELQKCTEDTHPDSRNLPVALNSMNELARYINDEKKERDMVKKLTSTIKGYDGVPLTSLGGFEKDGEIAHKVDDGKKNNKLKMRYVFLFKEAAIICKPAGATYKYKQMIMFKKENKYEVGQVAHWQLPKSEDDKYTYAWSVTGKEKGKEVAHLFAAKNPVQKKKWMSSMQRSLQQETVAPAAPDRPKESRDQAVPHTPDLPPKPVVPSSDRPVGGYEDWKLPGAGGGSGPEPEPSEVDSAAASNTAEDDSSWFAGPMSRGSAENILNTAKDGSFLVRESDREPGAYSLSLKYQVVKHIKIGRRGNDFELAPDAKAFPTIHELVEHFVIHSLNRHFPGLDTRLAIPSAKLATTAAVLHGAIGAGALPPGVGRARARFAYNAQSPDELSFTRGEEIVIESEDCEDSGWWKGRLESTNAVGIFPSNYVQRL